MTLMNLASTTLNVDGSTTVFGAQGNAIEDLVAGSATTVFAAPAASAVGPPVPIWYAPAPFGQYFQNILDNPQLFQTIGDIKVFKLYLSLDWPDATLKAFFAYCAANNVKLGAEAPALVANAGDLGSGIEGFASTGAMLAAMARIKSLGGTLSYISWDEPFYFGSTITGRYTMAEVAAQVAASASAVKAIFPNVQVGDIEPVDIAMNSAATVQAWLAAYAKASGSQFASFLADTNTESPNWQSNLANTIAVAHADGIPVGEIIVANGAAPNNAAWAATAVSLAMQMLSDPSLRPDYLDVQSWAIYPSESADPGLAGTLASVAADIAAGESAALAIPAVASYGAKGILQSVKWSGGGTAAENGTTLFFTSSTGTVVAQFAWSDVRVFAFQPGAGTVSLTVLNTAYAVSAASGSFVFAPGEAPGAVAGSGLALALAPASATGFAGSGITDQLTPSLTGTAAPNSTIQLQIDGTSAGSAVASATGAWTFAIAAPLAAGAHLIEATGGAAPGAGSQQSLYVVSVDPAQRLSSTLGLAAGSDTGYAGDGITDDTLPVFSGVDDPDVRISVSIDGKQVGTATTGVNGDWTYTPASALARGTHSVTVSAAGPPGTSPVATTMQVTIDTAAQEAAMTSPDPLFDPAWYLQQHPGIASSAAAAYAQYMTTGWKAGYDPSPFFSTSYYLAQNPDVAANGMNPLLHFENYGWQEDRDPSATFDTAAYEAANPGLPAGEDPLVAYIDSLTIGGTAATVPAAPALTTPAQPTITLTTGENTVVGAGNDTIVAASNALTGAASIDGGTGSNTLLLTGGGMFDLALPALLTDIQSVSAQEGQGTTAQSVTLRAGLDVTVNVASDTVGDSAPGIAILGAANHDAIDLGSGDDQVRLGAGETVNGGGGDNIIVVTADSETVNGGSGNNTIILPAAMLGAAIDGGSGIDTLVITGGGTAAMGGTVTGISDVQLAAQTTFTANGTAGMQIAGSSGGGDLITLGAPGQSVTSGGTGERVFVSALDAGAQVSGLGIGSKLEITSGGSVTLNAATGGSAGDLLTVKLNAATNLTLSPVQFIHAVGGNGGDTITAAAAGQTLSGGGGTDTLVGYAGGYDTFRNSVAALEGVTIGDFLPTDQIDIRNLNPAGATLTATASQADTAVSIVSGAVKAGFLMTGSFGQSGFALASDGAGGTIVTHT